MEQKPVYERAVEQAQDIVVEAMTKVAKRHAIEYEQEDADDMVNMLHKLFETFSTAVLKMVKEGQDVCAS